MSNVNCSAQKLTGRDSQSVTSFLARTLTSLSEGNDIGNKINPSTKSAMWEVLHEKWFTISLIPNFDPMLLDLDVVDTVNINLSNT